MIEQLFNAIERVPILSWRSMLEHARQLKGLLMRVSLVVSASISSEVGLAACSFVRTVFRLKRKSGLLYTALYLKQCAVSLQRYYAGNYRKGDGLSVRIGLTRSGIPTIIPAVLRKHIRARSDRGDRLVRLYLSWFGVSKLIKVAPKVTKGTFSTISTPHRDIGSVKEVLGEIKDSFRELQPTYLPDLPFIPLTKGMTWEPTWKATPLVDRWVRRFNITIDPEKDRVMAALSKYSNIFANLKHEIAAFIWNINKIHSIPDGFFSPGILWFPRTLYPLDYKTTTEMAMWDL